MRPVPPRRRIIVAGGGIGGLTAALGLARAGREVTLLERAGDFGAVGAGLQITPNGAAVLSALGLGPALDAAGLRAAAVVPTDGLTGRPIARFDLSGRDYRFLHRADLIDLLAEAVRREGVEIRHGTELVSAGADGHVSTADGRDLQAGLVVGADGIRSTLRGLLRPGEAPFFTGQVAWRAVIDAPDQPAEARIWMLPGRHVVTYPLPGGRLNIVAVREQGGWAPEGWDHPDDPDNLRSAFADAAPELRGWLGRIGAVRLWGLFRHEVAPRWHDGARVLLGDAAHPTLPFLAQGANLAIEDGWVLADCLAREAGHEAALARYQALRRPRVVRAIAAANANARNYHLRGPARRVAHLGLGLLGRVAPGRFLDRMDWLYGYDATRDTGVAGRA
ncbi:FAD-dependent monooxygenase [Limimaricola pyoseonensis]|uniref:Salicylate hydroxylase n=1 Tax=Limimaricola pyoseonensis TaxID=521013 RepID=A0A1G7AVG0_9RHOB|nr:FAD-dependent monooxygenase [Limimaricola pyoseonensis]SDE17936.1 salicylate hydroxylase [Limimaricola pyoseonensis]